MSYRDLMHRSKFVRKTQWIRYAASVAFLGGLASERWINVLWALSIGAAALIVMRT
jgi:hypothetical protein